MAQKKQLSLAQRLQAFLSKPQEAISEIIGRVSYDKWAKQLRVRPTVDYTQIDYEWYDKFRRGKQAGYEIGGLFAQPMTEIIASWALSEGFSLESDNESLDEAIEEFLEANLQSLIETFEDMLALGDAYLLVNVDGSLQKISPEQVEIERDELDFTQIISMTVVTDNDGVQIRDKFTATQRTVTINRAGNKSEQTFPNLIGMIPIVQFSNDRSPNEAYGHPFFEPLLTLFADYDDVLRGSVDGVKLMGNPVPVVEGLEDAESAQKTNATYTDTYIDAQGTTQTEYRTELASNKMYFFGKGANFKFASPNAFADNSATVLKKLFYVMLQHAKIPEWVWGGAISSSMASVEAQTPAFIKFIQGQQRKLEKPIRELLTIYLNSVSLFTPNLSADDELTLVWPELMPQDKAMMLQWVQYLQQNGMMTKESALRLSDLVDSPNEEIEKAKAESEAAAMRQTRRDLANQAMQLRRPPMQTNPNERVDENPPPL